MSDEPLLDPSPPPRATAGLVTLPERIEALIGQQRYAVLCTQGGGQPYGSLVAVAVSEDLATAVFATPITTRKFRLLSECDHVALVIDSRAGPQDDMLQIEAMTLTGRARRIWGEPEFARWACLLIGRHPHLESFIRSPTTAVFCVDIFRYFHVTRFQEVRQWTPPRV